jgi:hypothetical protein
VAVGKWEIQKGFVWKSGRRVRIEVQAVVWGNKIKKASGKRKGRSENGNVRVLPVGINVADVRMD